jgi:hypothetical protein
MIPAKHSPIQPCAVSLGTLHHIVDETPRNKGERDNDE